MLPIALTRFWLMSETKDLVKTTVAKRENLSVHETVFCAVCALFVGFFVRMADPNSPLESKTDAGSSYYNLLVQGFSEGHLYVKRDAPTALVQLADPYDPIANRPYISNVGDMSYYHGRLYLYFGIAPALLLFWPFHVLTGHYLSDASAVAILFASGFAVALALMRAVRRRYFAEVNVWMLTASVLALGVILGLTLEDNYNQVAITSGFAFAMPALAAIWCALHSRQKQRIFWMLLASLMYGFAVGSRPSLLFGVVVLLIPVAQAWREAVEPGERQRTGLLLAAAVGPVTLIGFGLMLYNDLRFGSPFEFGFRYQLTAAYEPTTATQLSPRYFWFNFRYYFLEQFSWSGHFPFLKSVQLPPSPSGFYPGVRDVCGGIFTSYPFVFFAFAVPSAWMNRPPATASPLRWFVAAVFLLFVACAVTLCLFINAAVSFELDFLPWVMVFSVIGFLGLTRVALHARHYGPLVNSGWCLLLVYSVAFSALSNIEIRARADCTVGNNFYYDGRLNDALSQYQKAGALWPDCADAHYGFANILVKKGDREDAIAEYQKVLEIQPDYAQADNNLGYTLIQLGRPGEAIVYFQSALKFEQGSKERAYAYYNLGYVFQQDGRAADAKDCYQKAIELQPQFIPAQVGLAWILATWPEASLRNGSLAVALMEKANQLSDGNDPKVLRTLAAAYAEAGQFDDAIATAQKAIALAKQNGQTNLLEQNEGLLDFYLKHQPYHQRRANTGN